jgi:hypothetical protein
MPEEVYYVRIKKSYAADVIEDLKKMDAIELLEEPPIPEWQKKEVQALKEEEEQGKNSVVNNIKKGLKEVQQFKKGKLKTTPAKDFLNEL